MSDVEYSGASRVRSVPSSTPVGTEDLTLNAAEVMGGLQAGLIAGFAMGVMVFFVSLGYGLGPWRPFNDVAGMLIPAFAGSQTFNFLAIPIAMVIHLTSSVLLGMLFAAIYSGVIKLTFGFGLNIMVGVLFGLLIWLLVRFIGMPLSGSEMYRAPAFLTTHAVFGALLGILYPLMPARQSS